MLLDCSGLAIDMDEATGELSFREGVECDGWSEKRLGGMEGLYVDLSGCDLDQRVYWAYRNIRRSGDEPVLLPKDVRYDITVILPGDANGEFFKTSGHYHGYGPHTEVPYPELYEVLSGEVLFVLQRDSGFTRTGEESGRLDDVFVVHAKAGEALVIPPFCGHGSINAGTVPAAFSNLAVHSCPVLYDAVKAHHGLACRLMSAQDGFAAVRNEEYGTQPEAKVVRCAEARDFGFEFGEPCYARYVEDPSRFAWLTRPDEHLDAFDSYLLDMRER